MKKVATIAAKELGIFFKSPIAYIVLVITISVFNVFFFLIIDQNREASLRDMFKLMEFMFVFILPLLTMKIFAEEKRSGTIEFLMTSPVGNTAIVLGKYLGALLFFTVILLFTSVYYFIIEYFSEPDRWAIVAGYLGIWLEGALFIAIGILMSSWTKNQIIAAMSSYLILFSFYFSISFIKYFDAATQGIIKHASFWSHTENFVAGLFTLEDLIYYVSGIFFFIALTRLSIENKIWK